VIGVFRHGDITPKQKIRIVVKDDPALLDFFDELNHPDYRKNHTDEEPLFIVRHSCPERFLRLSDLLGRILAERSAPLRSQFPLWSATPKAPSPMLGATAMTPHTTGALAPQQLRSDGATRTGNSEATAAALMSGPPAHAASTSSLASTAVAPSPSLSATPTPPPPMPQPGPSPTTVQLAVPLPQVSAVPPSILAASAVPTVLTTSIAASGNESPGAPSVTITATASPADVTGSNVSKTLLSPAGSSAGALSPPVVEHEPPQPQHDDANHVQPAQQSAQRAAAGTSSMSQVPSVASLNAMATPQTLAPSSSGPLSSFAAVASAATLPDVPACFQPAYLRELQLLRAVLELHLHGTKLQIRAMKRNAEGRVTEALLQCKWGGLSIRLKKTQEGMICFLFCANARALQVC